MKAKPAVIASALAIAFAASPASAQEVVLKLHHFLPPLFVMFMILLIYIFLGCVMDALAMILLTIPIFYPMVMGLDFFGMSQDDKSIWFGILALMVVEIGLVHPPVGMNVYIINRLAKDVPLTETFKGVIPFLLSDLVRTTLLVFFPILSLYLVHTFK